MIFDIQAFYRFQLRATKFKTYSFPLLDRVSEELIERVLMVNRKFNKAIFYSIGMIEGVKQLNFLPQIENIASYNGKDFLNDFVSFINFWEGEFLKKKQVNFILAPFLLQPRNDVLNFLKRINSSLQEDGLFLSVTLGENSLIELQQSMMQAELSLTQRVSSRIGPFPSVQTVGQVLLSTGFRLPVVDVENVIIEYSHIDDLFNDLRCLGWQNTLVSRDRCFVHPQLFNLTKEIYENNFKKDNVSVPATFSLFFLSGWKAPSQELPLPRPGSAQISLKTVLEKLEKKQNNKL